MRCLNLLFLSTRRTTLFIQIQFPESCMAASVIFNEQYMESFVILIFALISMNLVLKFTLYIKKYKSKRSACVFF